MLFFILLPITSCLANVSNSSQPSQPPNATKSVPESNFIWVAPPTVEWPRFTHHHHHPHHHHHSHPPKHHHHPHHHHPHPTFGPSSPFSPFKSFPDLPLWFHKRHKRFHPPHHHHPHHHHGHHGHHHHHDFHPHYDFPFPVNEMIPTEIFEAKIPYQRKEDMVKTNGSEMAELDSPFLSTMEKLMSEKFNSNVEILKSIEMVYDPEQKKFVQKQDEGVKTTNNSPHPQKKRSDASETALFTPKIKQNLQNVLTKFEKERSNENIAFWDKKNFQTGRFKSKEHGVKIPLYPNAPQGNNTSKNNLLELICNVKSSGPKIDSIPSATVRPDRFSRNANYYKWSNSDLMQKGDNYTDWDNNSISVYIDDPKFFNFLHGNWSKGGVPIMLTATKPNNKGHDHKNCNPG